MSNIKISEMQEATGLNDDDLLTIVQGGMNKKITKQNAIGDIIGAINNPTYTTTEGTDLTITNSRVGNMKFEFYGNTTQLTTTGKNLLKYRYDIGYTETINGVKWTINQDGSITANGTASTTSIFQFATATELAPLVGETVSFNGTPSNAPVYTYMGLYNADWSNLIDVQAGQDKSATITSDTTRCLARVGAGETANNLVFYPMIRLSTISDASYEPYTRRNYRT